MVIFRFNIKWNISSETKNVRLTRKKMQSAIFCDRQLENELNVNDEEDLNFKTHFCITRRFSLTVFLCV